MLKSNKGFSLIELVVVMAIVGVLMMIGVPQIQNYIAKAKRTEMRTNLSQIYQAQKSFNAEYSTYLADLSLVGYTPEGTMNYIYGFTANGGVTIPVQLPGGGQAVQAANMTTDSICGTPAQLAAKTAGFTCFKNKSAEDASPPAGNYTVSQTAFVAYAAGNIQDPAITDEWGIDQRKITYHISSGIDSEPSPTDQLPQIN